MFNLAMIQMRVDGGNKSANLARALQWIERAANEGAQVILLPEAMNVGWTDPSAETDADRIPDSETFRQLAAAARQHAVYLCFGLIESAGGRRFNTAVLMGPDGELLLRHRKINELEIAHEHYGLGNRLEVAETAVGRIGVMICADAFARGQVLSRALGYMGADMILSPCAWAVQADHENAATPYGGLWLDNYGPVARDFRIWIAGASNVGYIREGPWKGRKCIGSSLLIGPNGQEMLRGPYGENAESLILAEISLVPRPAQGDGWARAWQ